jgi:hypothetical protein
VNIRECVPMAGYLRMVTLMIMVATNPARLYQGSSPGRNRPYHQTFAAFCRRLAETGILAPITADQGRSRLARTPDLDERILNMFLRIQVSA